MFACLCICTDKQQNMEKTESSKYWFYFVNLMNIVQTKEAPVNGEYGWYRENEWRLEHRIYHRKSEASGEKKRRRSEDTVESECVWSGLDFWFSRTACRSTFFRWCTKTRKIRIETVLHTNPHATEYKSWNTLPIFDMAHIYVMCSIAFQQSNNICTQLTNNLTIRE